MRVCVLGLWHLGTVTAACLAWAGFQVTGLDFDVALVASLTAGKSPIFEPRLDNLLQEGLASGRLGFTTGVAAAVSQAEVIWVACDTPVDHDDRADVAVVTDQVVRLFPHLRDGALVVVSSQLPVGTTRQFEQDFARVAHGRTVGFAYSPENLRLGEAIDAFTKPERVVAGVRSAADRLRLTALLRPFAGHIEWMSVESAEMTKHALNAFLAMSVTFINEIAALCEQVGADAIEVERGLKSERRIGQQAYLAPGSAFAGGTLARDVVFLSRLGDAHGVATHLLASIKTSNDAHGRWAQQRLDQLLDGVSGKIIAVWGLTYKPGTDTLRRSRSIELCQWLADHGATVRAHDPAVKVLPQDLTGRITLADSALSATERASALVVSTPWPEYRTVGASEVTAHMSRQLILDANRFTSETLGRHASIEYVSVGHGRMVET